MKGSFDILLPSSWSITGEPDKYLHHLQHPFPHATVRIWADDGSFLFEQIYIGISISVYSYLMRHRIAHCYELLDLYQLNPTDVAYRMGFTDAAHFNRVFKHYYGFPPGNVGKDPKA